MIETVVFSHFKELPKFIRRITIGISNEVYEVGLRSQVVIARLSPYDKYLRGSHDHIPKFKALGIKVPEILVEDYSKRDIPLAYQIQSKIEGYDLGEVIEALSDDELKALGKEVASIFKKVSTLPSSDKFGLIWGGGEEEVSDSWTERMKIWLEESKERGLKTGVMDSEMKAIGEGLYGRYKAYFDSVKPITYYGDISSKNIMIQNGVFNGLVDLDGLTQGDPLEAIGRIQIAWYGTRYGELYTRAIMDELGLDQVQREVVLMYALLNKIAESAENGIQFNENTRDEVNWEKAKACKAVIKRVAGELKIRSG